MSEYFKETCDRARKKWTTAVLIDTANCLFDYRGSLAIYCAAIWILVVDVEFN